VLLNGNTLVCPSSTEDDGWQIHIEFTSDRGRTWERTAALNDGRKVAAIQPSVLIHKPGTVQILCRSRNRSILSSRSDDNGRTWSKLSPTGLPNPNSGIDAVTLRDGSHVLVYNHVDPSSEWGDRNILNVAVSDDGTSWKAAVLLENDPDSQSEYSYPAVIQTSDGMLHITYTWNRRLIRHVVIDPGKFETSPFRNGEWPGL
jgi:predicted neuraminidase